MRTDHDDHVVHDDDHAGSSVHPAARGCATTLP
jgi:hypothetical protein